MTPFQNQSPTLTYDVFALKRPGLTRDLPPGTESLQWTANTASTSSQECYMDYLLAGHDFFLPGKLAFDFIMPSY